MRLKRLICSFLVICMMLSMCCSVYALPSSGSAAERTNSMISFFQNAAQGIDTGNISRNELGVYSVFLSNFYLPGVTRVSDITSSDISEILTKQFIGEGVSADTMTALNGVVKDIIVESMTKSDDSILKIDGQTMTGKRLAEGMAKASDGTGVSIMQLVCTLMMNCVIFLIWKDFLQP